MVGVVSTTWEAATRDHGQDENDTSLLATGTVGRCHWYVCMYDTYVANKTISVPSDVIPIIDSLDVPFSTWVTEQLRRHAAAQTQLDLGQQFLADAALAGEGRPTDGQSRRAMERMERSAPW